MTSKLERLALVVFHNKRLQLRSFFWLTDQFSCAPLENSILTQPIIIKKYSNRRLYDTESKQYVNLEQLAQIIRDGKEVQVIDNQTKKDITQEILLQIITGNNSQNLFSSPLLHKLIRVQEENFQEFLQFYLGSSLDHYNRFKDNMNNQFRMWGDWWKSVIPSPAPFAQQQDTRKEEELDSFRSRMEEYEKKIRDLESRLSREK